MILKKLFKVIIWLLAIAFLIFIIANITISALGKKIIISQIEKNLKLKAKINTVGFRFPLTIVINEFQLEDLIDCTSVSFSVNPFGFLVGKVILNGIQIVSPVIKLTQFSDGSLNLPGLGQKPQAQTKVPNIILASLRIENGRIIFTDNKVNSQGFKVVIDNINAYVSKVAFPVTSLKAKFYLFCKVKDMHNQSLGSIEGNGWVDFTNKDMDAVFNIKGLEVTYFSSYYGDFFSRRLASAFLSTSSKLKAKNNNLAIATNLRLYGLVYAQEEGEVLPGINLAKNALDLFVDSQGNLNLDFTVNTQLDNPRLSPGELKRVILDAALRNLSGQSADQLMEKVGSIVDQFKDFGKQMEDIFKKGE